MITHSTAIDATAIHMMGFAPFYTNFSTDHRGIFMDVNIRKLFNYTRPDTTRPIYKRFTTIHVTKCDRYLKKLEELMESARIFHSIDELKVAMQSETKDKEETNEMIKRCKALFIKVTEFMLSSEKKSGAIPYHDGYPSSPKLKEAAFTVIRIKKYLRMISLGIMPGTRDEYQLAKEDLKNAQINLRLHQKSSQELRREHLAILAEKRATQWNMKSAEALHILIESEASTKTHDRQRRLLKPNMHGTLRSLLVPAPVTGLPNNIKDSRLYTEVHDKQTMFDILLRRNFDQLRQSRSSMFSHGPLLDKCGWYGEGTGIDELLEGLIDADEMGKQYPEFGQEGVEFLRALRKDTTGKTKGEFDWKFGLKEYMDVFKNTKESTACGPSGLHMSHWKAACERPCIAEVHAFFIWAAFKFGFTYTRWENSWQCMIQKLSKPILPKLRIIQLFEGDFNAGLKYLIGRKLMHHMNDDGTHDIETFGSRTGKTAPEALLNLQLLFDHSRTWQIPTGIFFNDAIGCYDRIVPALSDIAMQRKGCPQGITRCHTLTQKNMVHRIRIAAGVSEGFLRFALRELIQYAGNHISFIEGRTGGVGQGGGGGPMAWIAIIDVMIEAYRKMATGATAEDPINLYSLTYWLVSYVDDNTLVMSFPNTEMTGLEILEKMTGNLRTWQRLLQLTGGDIDLEKSKWCIMQWRHSTTWGVPQIESAKTFKGTIGINSPISATDKNDNLSRLEPWEADRVLGLRLPMTGSMSLEYEYRMKQIKTLAKKLYTAPFSHQEAYQVYFSRYRPIVCYPLPVTLFSIKQCDQIQKKFIFHLLPKIGLNRHMPRAVIYGPKHLGGREIMDLRVEQRVAHWGTTTGHLRRGDRAGKGLRLTLNDHQCVVGSSTQFLLLDPNKYNYVDKKTRWYYSWEMMWDLQIETSLYDPWVPTTKYLNDKNIIDTAVNDTTLTKSKWPLLYHVNCCRLYLQVFYISDMTLDGESVHQGYLDGTNERQHDFVKFSSHKKPTEAQWKIWKSFIFRNFLGSPGYRINPAIIDTQEINDIPHI